MGQAGCWAIFIFTTSMASFLSWVQLYGFRRFPVLEHSYIVLLILGIPISYFYIKSATVGLSILENRVWAVGLISNAVVMGVFALSSWFMVGESITVRTMICLILSILVILIQSKVI